MDDRLVIIGPTSPFRGGIVHYTTRLFSVCKSLGFTVSLFSFSRMYPAWLYPGKSDRDADSVTLDDPEHFQCIDSHNPFSWVLTALKIGRLKPSVVVLNWWTAFWSPVYITLVLLLRVFSPNTKIVYICHNVFDHERSFFKELLAKLSLRCADGFIVHSQKEKSLLHHLFSKKDVCYAPLPLFDVFDKNESDHAGLCEKYGLKDTDKVLLFFGFVRPYKGLDDLIIAFRDAQKQELDLKLLVVGEFMFDLYDHYSQMIRKLDLEDCVILENKYVSNDAVAQYFSLADLLVLPYKSATGSAILTISYHLDTPVIATSVGNFPQVIMHDRTGYLVPPDRPEILAQHILRFYNEQKSVSFSENIRMEKKKYSWSNIVDQILYFCGEKNIPKNTEND